MDVISAGCPLGATCEKVVEKDGKQVIARCLWYTMLRGKDPQSGKDIDEWGCAITFLPMLLIENSNQTRMGNAAIDKLASVVLKKPATLTTFPLSDSQLPKELVNGKQTD